jgi:drug/metabolite transporter (DMT)-like permease
MPRPSSRLFAHPAVLLSAASLLWAGNSIVGKLAVGEVSPMAMTSLRWTGVLAGPMLFRSAETIAAWKALLPRWRWIAVMGAIGYTSFNALLYAAAHHTSGLNMTILQGSLPVFIILVGFFVHGIRVRRLQTAGILLTLLGVAALASGGDPGRLMGLAFNVGDLFLIAACVLYAFYTHGLRDRPAVSALAMFSGFVVAALAASLPLVAIEAAVGAFQAPTAFGWLLMIYIIIGPSFLSQLFYIRGVELIGPARAGVFINLVPVFGALMAVLLLGEAFGPHHVVAIVLVLTGIVLAERGKAR